jgi:hypothetical protein
MAEQHNRRKNHLFGMEFDISVKWLLIIIVMGLVQFGVFWEQFRQVGNDIADIKTALQEGVTTGHALFIKDAQQDGRIVEIEKAAQLQRELKK